MLIHIKWIVFHIANAIGNQNTHKRIEVQADMFQRGRKPLDFLLFAFTWWQSWWTNWKHLNSMISFSYIQVLSEFDSFIWFCLLFVYAFWLNKQKRRKKTETEKGTNRIAYRWYVCCVFILGKRKHLRISFFPLVKRHRKKRKHISSQNLQMNHNWMDEWLKWLFWFNLFQLEFFSCTLFLF